ncbi:putative membrane protein [Paenibacillus phyllosphaerae]|uniref:Putative membrane protein n=1 Tax=Paenibacillus phyllosphaerae TaxID=274593 RepID=A0A7W5FNN0_9BACL|nr:DUF1648 domain-containing protein [Paenibacillus phyllosphaerae]MBB3111358.1 putative membrane protein [Paenibacillus phyllosphaerae]
MKTMKFPLLLIAAAIILSLAFYSSMPDQMAIHWNAHGEPDRYASKGIALFLPPVIMGALLAAMILSSRMDPNQANIQSFRSGIGIIRIVLLAVLLGIHMISIAHGLGYAIDVMVAAPVCVGVLFMVIGNYMPTIRPNYTIGIRNRWTLTNDKVWKLTHQTSARWFVGAGLLMLLTPFLGYPWHVIALLLLAFGATIVSVLLSYRYAQMEHSSK